MSRVDLVLVLLDIPTKDYDKEISTFLLQRALRVPLSIRSTAYSVTSQTILGNIKVDVKDQNELKWNMDSLRAYVLYCREVLNPVMSPAAQLLLVDRNSYTLALFLFV